MPTAPDLSVASASLPPLRGGGVVASRGLRVGRPLHVSIGWLLGVAVAACLLVALLVQQWFAREAMLQQLQQRNREAAAWLALALRPDGPDAPVDAQPAAPREAVLAAHLDAARLERLQLRDAEGRIVWRHEARARPARAPAVYAELMALEPGAGDAPLRDQQGRPAGSVQVAVSSAEALDALWQGLLHSALALALLGGAVAAVAAWRVRALRRALARAVEQANALSKGRYLRQARPALPELQPLAASMNLLVERLQVALEARKEQLEAWRQQAHADPLTGLAARRHFLARFEQLLAGDAVPARLGVLLLRVRDLQGMNRRIGHAATDHVLQALAQTLTNYPSGTAGCFCGRLNGSDFALVLPVGGLAQDTAQALVRALRLPIITIDAAAGVSIGAVELSGAVTVQQALALADEALACAETDVAFSSACVGDAQLATPYGEGLWQQRLSLALEQGRVQLASFPVCTPDGRVLHLDCPIRVQIEPGGAFEPASRWLAQAARARLCAAVDERAVELALQAIEDDGRARCINISAQSLGVSDFMAAVSRRLEAAPQAASRLWIDLPEVLALDRPLLVKEATRRWRPLGVYVGLEHAGEALARIPHLLELGLDCVRIDSRYVQGLAAADAGDARRYLHGLVQLVQSVGLSITAEGVTDEADLALLWSLGFDAATGPLLREGMPLS